MFSRVSSVAWLFFAAGFAIVAAIIVWMVALVVLDVARTIAQAVA